MYSWTTNIRYVKGIGPTKTKELASIGIHVVGDLLEYRPLDYIYPGVQKIADLPTEGNVIINGTVKEIRHIRDNVVGAVIADETGECAARWYGSTWLLNNVQTGTKLTLWGKVNRRVLHQPKFSTANFNVYEITGGQYGVHSGVIREALREVFSSLEIDEWMTPDRGIKRSAAFYYLHNPLNKDVYEVALDRLKFDEALLMQLALELRRKQVRQKAACKINHYNVDYLNLMNLFPYRFTRDQDAAIVDITTDLSSDKPMSRLLHGEVGSGKTAVAFYAAMLAALNGKRTLILCPTTILAIQHYETLRGMGWEDAKLLIGGYENAASRDKHIVIGTTALLCDAEMLKGASLVIVDEQHKFGVHQRALLQKHGNPHVLLMSATPIPRTLAMTVFGDLNISTIKELPIKRGTVVTKWVLPGKREQMYQIIANELNKKHQVYVVYPRIDSGDEDTDNAHQGFDNLAFNIFPDVRCELLTGTMSNSCKADTLQKFKNGEVRILVSTIIAEVGLDCPNATVMVIEGADRFGLSQLHQLRGRVCRSTDTSFCFLVAETANETSIARLNVMEQTNDGFEIAEHDLRLRGPGEMFSTRQYGLPDLKFVDAIEDYELMVAARGLAQALVDKLDLPEYAGLKEMLQIKYKGTLTLCGVA